MITTETRKCFQRRREAARQLPPLACGCRDPWPCRHYDGPATEGLIDGYRDACQHLLDEGYPPAPDLVCLRALWRRRGADQKLAVEVAQRWELAR